MIVQKLLYIYKRARTGIEPSISFLYIGVSSLTEDDNCKLTRILQFLSETIEDKRVIGANSLEKLNTWVDTAYVVHPNMAR